LKATQLRELEGQLTGEILFDEPLSGYTTYRIGGPAAAMVVPASVDDVVMVLSVAQESGTPWLALGLGSNVLIADKGFDGIVIRLGKGLDAVKSSVGGDERLWKVGAGLPTPQLARRTAKAGLTGVHRLVGVPGTVGGGVYMNAGAHGQDFATVVRSAELVKTDGSVQRLQGSEIPWRYRSSGLGDVIVVSATVELEPGEPAELDEDVRKHLAWRKAGTPFAEPCCGSVFRNPVASPKGEESRTAGKLIDELGLKGFRVGGAQVSTLHANYVVNAGNATASDVMAVIDEVRNRVMAEYGVELELEVKVVS
jgi:UDP-N-acetylmuramate dehydrogenase